MCIVREELVRFHQLSYWIGRGKGGTGKVPHYHLKEGIGLDLLRVSSQCHRPLQQLLSKSSGRSGFAETARSLTMVTKPKYQAIAWETGNGRCLVKIAILLTLIV